ncbi:MAG: PAS domain S-box protein [Candidatus Omnitrophica bacterium]|nr:PAS domain S-box protein [Candidatus Omnitrophota bacterium]
MCQKRKDMEKTNILIVGAGKGGCALLELLLDNDYVNISGVVDKDKSAPGLRIARDAGIPTAGDYADFIGKGKIDEVVNVTGSEEVQKELLRDTADEVEIIGGHSAKLMWRLVDERKRVGEHLRRSEKRFRMLAEASMEGVLVHDGKKIIEANNALADMMGYDPGKIVGTEVIDIVAPESHELVRKNIKQAYEKPYEAVGRKSDGSTFPILIRAKTYTYDGSSWRVAAIRDLSRQKKAEAALRENEQRLRLITENTSDLVAVTTLGGTYKYLSPSHKRILGYSPEELIGRSGYDYMHPKDIEQVENIALKYTENRLRSLFSKGQKFIGETLQYRFKNKAGQWRDIEATANIVWSSLDREFNVIFISRDITARKKMTEDMHRQRQLLSNILSNIPHYVFWKNTDLVYQGCNENFARVAGVGEPENIVGKTDYDLAWKKEEADFFRKCDKEVIKNRKPMLNIEEPQLQADGKEATLLTSKVPLVDSEGNVFGMLGIYADITDRKNMEEILRQSEAMYRTIFENTGSSMVIVDENLLITMSNDQFERLSGYSKKKLQGVKSLVDFIPEEDKRRIKEFHRLKMIDSEATPGSYELSFMDKNGEEKEIYVTVAVIPGMVKSVISILDISDLKENERELRRQKELLDNTNRALEHKLKELEQAAGHIKKLEGLVPICARCKKMRVEGGNPKEEKDWVSLEKYISERTDASFTHGLCPQCIREMYGSMGKGKE